jgi:hypothetical protein
MGQSQSNEPPHEVPIEELSHQLALRFAAKCYSHLEIAHFKDNFKTLADHVDGIEYWKEDTLSKFLCLPEPIRAAPVLNQICTYLGAFPFASRLSPCILTREAMIKVVTIMTGRYKKVLKRGNRDKFKLLFRSMAVFDRRASIISPSQKPSMKEIVDEQKPDDMLEEDAVLEKSGAPAQGYAIDLPANDDEDEDDDDLVLAALDSLNAIEVFKHDQKADRKINRAMIPVENFKRFIMLLLFFAGIDSQTTLSAWSNDLDEVRVKSLEDSASAIMATFDPDPENHGIRYSNFVNVLSTTIPNLFEPLNALFEHFMFSKNIDLSKHKGEGPSASVIPNLLSSPIWRAPDDTVPTIFTSAILAQISTSLLIGRDGSTPVDLYTSKARFNQLYSTATHGTSLSSFGRQLTSWHSSTLLLISGSTSTLPSGSITLAAHLPQPWKDSTNSYSSPSHANMDPSAPQACMLQLHPRHAMMPANPYSHSAHSPPSYFSTRSGIALGCIIPSSSRAGPSSTPIPSGPVSLLIDTDISTATFVHDPDAGAGTFNIDPHLASAQPKAQPTKIEFDIESLEVWGVSFPSPGEGDDEVTKQQKRLAWDEAEAARRRGVNFGGDKDGARALLEMAGLVGDKAGQGRSGGSV